MIKVAPVRTQREKGTTELSSTISRPIPIKYSSPKIQKVRAVPKDVGQINIMNFRKGDSMEDAAW